MPGGQVEGIALAPVVPAVVGQPEKGQELRPGPVPLVHGVRVLGTVLAEMFI